MRLLDLIVVQDQLIIILYDIHVLPLFLRLLLHHTGLLTLLVDEIRARVAVEHRLFKAGRALLFWGRADAYDGI